MRHTAKIALENNLSREVRKVDIREDKIVVTVVVAQHDNERLKTSFRHQVFPIFCNSKDEESAIEYSIDKATELFLGLDSTVAVQTSKQIEAAITQAPNNQEVPRGESKNEEDGSKKKASRKSSSKKQESKKLDTESAPQEAQPEEMEEVESPFKETKSTAEPYNREDKTSKASFAVFATKLHGGSKDWKTREDLKAISTTLHGMPFMEKDGSIHPSFEAKCKELFGLK